MHWGDVALAGQKEVSMYDWHLLSLAFVRFRSVQICTPVTDPPPETQHTLSSNPAANAVMYGLRWTTPNVKMDKLV